MAQVLPAERDLRRVIGDGDAVPDREVEGLRTTTSWSCIARLVAPAHLRRALGRLPPPGPDRHLRDLLEPRGDAGRARSTRSTTTDWIFPSYRESAIGLLRGMPVSTVLSWWRGHPAGWWNPADYNVASICVPIGTHVPHAAGLAWGKRLRGEKACAIAYFGDGATSEGAFHEGANLAAVIGAPLVLFCNNNQLGDLDAARGADPGRRPWPTRRSGTGCPGCASTGSTCSRSTRRRVKRWSARGRARGRRSSRPCTTGRRRTRLRTTPRRTSTWIASRRSARASASGASRATCAGRGS